MRIKTAKIGFSGESEIITLDTKPNSKEVSWNLEDADGVQGDPGIEYETQENPNGGDYFSLRTGRKPSRTVTVKFRVVSYSDPFDLFLAQQKINSLTSEENKGKLFKLVFTEDFGAKGVVTTVIDDCRIAGGILTRTTSQVALECQITFISKTGQKGITVTVSPTISTLQADFDTTIANVTNLTNSNKYPTQSQLNAQIQKTGSNKVTVTSSGYSATVKAENTELNIKLSQSINFAPSVNVINQDMDSDFQNNYDKITDAVNQNPNITVEELNNIKEETHYNNVEITKEIGAIKIVVTNPYTDYVLTDTVVIPEDTGGGFNFYTSVYNDTLATRNAIDAAYGNTVDHEITSDELYQYIPSQLGHPNTTIFINVSIENISITGTNPGLLDPVFLSIPKPVYDNGGGDGGDPGLYNSVYNDTLATINAIDAAFGDTSDHEITEAELYNYVPNPLGRPDTMISISVTTGYIIVAGSNPYLSEPIFLNIPKPVYTPTSGGNSEWIPGTNRYTIAYPFSASSGGLMGSAIDIGSSPTTIENERFRFEMWIEGAPENKIVWDFTLDSTSGPEIHLAYFQNGDYLDMTYSYSSGYETLVDYPIRAPFGNVEGFNNGPMVIRWYFDSRSTRTPNFYRYDKGAYYYPSAPDSQ
jgi:hypothetical protein